MFKSAFIPLACLAVGAGALSVLAAQPQDNTPDLSDARVTVPYLELKSLWSAAQQPQEAKEESKPPVQFAVVAARYQLGMDGERVTGTAEFEIQCFTNQWTEVPLLGTGAQVGAIEPPDAQVIIRDNHYQLVSNRPGKQIVTIHFSAPVANTRDGTQLLLPVTPASINTLTITGVPQKQTLRVANGTRVSGDKGSATYQLAPDDHLDVSLLPERMVEAPFPSHWKIEPQAYVQFLNGKLDYQARIAAHADDGSGLGMDLQIPPDANVSSITGADIARWQIKTGENQSQVAHVQWQTRDVLRREIELHYDLPQPLTATQWRLQAPLVADGESSPPLYLLALPAGLDLTSTNVIPAPRQLPKWLGDQAEGVNHLVFVGSAPLQAKWLPLVQTPHAVAENVQATMRIVADGAVLNEMEYDIRHESAYSWQLALPDGAELLASSVDGHPVNPIDRGGHVIEFSLPAGRQGDQVKLSYTAKQAAFQPVSGKISIDLPRTDLLTNKLAWALNIPAAYEVAACEGNVDPDTNSGQADADTRVIHLHREIFKGDRPSVELFYQKPEAIQ